MKQTIENILRLIGTYSVIVGIFIFLLALASVVVGCEATFGYLIRASVLSFILFGFIALVDIAFFD